MTCNCNDGKVVRRAMNGDLVEVDCPNGCKPAKAKKEKAPEAAVTAGAVGPNTSAEGN